MSTVDRSPSWYDLYQVNDKSFQFQCSVVFEFLGTFMFCYGIIASNGNNYVQAVVMGTMIWFAFLHSGAQYNPAVTLNMTLRKRMSWNECLAISITQLGAALTAGFFAQGVLGFTAYPTIGDSCVEKPDAIGLTQGFFQEIIGTFMLITLINIQTTAECQFTDQKGLIGVFFTFVFYTCRVYTGSSGGVLNPAIGLGFPIVGIIFNKEYRAGCTPAIDYQGIDYCWIWVLSAYLAGVLAFVFFQYLYYPTVLRVKYKQ